MDILYICVGVSSYTAKNAFLKFLNQEAFYRQVKMIVLFSEKSKLSEFFLKTMGKKITENKIILLTPLADYLLVLRKNSLNFDFFSENKTIIFTCL